VEIPEMSNAKENKSGGKKSGKGHRKSEQPQGKKKSDQPKSRKPELLLSETPDQLLRQTPEAPQSATSDHLPSLTLEPPQSAKPDHLPSPTLEPQQSETPELLSRAIEQTESEKPDQLPGQPVEPSACEQPEHPAKLEQVEQTAQPLTEKLPQPEHRESAPQHNNTHQANAAVAADNGSIDLHMIATAYGNYTKKSLEETQAFVEKLSGVRSLDKAMELQTEFAKQAYETFVSESQKIRELYRGLARQSLSPLENLVIKTTQLPR
jgi:phasin family protein